MKHKLPKVDMSETKPISLEIPPLLYRQFKAVVALEDMTVRDAIAGLIQRHVWESKTVPVEGRS